MEKRGVLYERSLLESVGEKSKQGFEGNRKQTGSSSSSHQKYEEFWKWNHFDPDAFIQEGFFEDNQREWHKYQKRLRKISGRIQRLTEEMLLSMDDDDVEDIYEDIDDLADDLEGREIPEQLRTWLTCQTRWWRSRVQRKHRNEDLVKGCGQQLVHWQLRVICKERHSHGKWKQVGFELNELCKTVISTQGRTDHTKVKLPSGKGASPMDIVSNAGQADWRTYRYSTKQQSDGTKLAFSNQKEGNSAGPSGLNNQTYPNHGASDLNKISWNFWWGNSHASCSDKSNSDIIGEHGESGAEHSPRTFFHRLDIKKKAGNSRMLFCHEDLEFSKYVQKREQWCKK